MKIDNANQKEDRADTLTETQSGHLDSRFPCQGAACQSACPIFAPSPIAESLRFVMRMNEQKDK